MRPNCRGKSCSPRNKAPLPNTAISSWPAFHEWVENVLIPSTGQSITDLFVAIRLDPIYATEKIQVRPDMKRKSTNDNKDEKDDRDDEADEDNDHSKVLQPIAQGRGPTRRSARATKKVPYAEL